MHPFRFCSEQECSERQKLRQVSEFEATLATCSLPQSKRILDPCLAVSKYRRSAAGGINDGKSMRTKEDLILTLHHLIRICAAYRATPDHPRVNNTGRVVDFVTDRIRACQSDATRLISSGFQRRVSASWHACVIRVLIWLHHMILYGVSNDDQNDESAKDIARTIHHMRSTAYDAYWDSRAKEAIDQARGRKIPLMSLACCYDDEMLCYDAIYRVCAISKASRNNHELSTLESSWNGILLEFSKRCQVGTSYPLWNLVLEIASYAKREEYYILWQQNKVVSKLPILARSILSNEVLLLWRYRTVQHYNISFGKGEIVSDMNRLLGIECFAESNRVSKGLQSNSLGFGWSLEYANIFGVPSEEELPEDGSTQTSTTTPPTINMQLKYVAMPEFDSKTVTRQSLAAVQNSDRAWVFGADFGYNSDDPMGLSSDSICWLLEQGTRESQSWNSCFITDKSTTPCAREIEKSPATSLARALMSSRTEFGNTAPRSSYADNRRSPKKDPNNLQEKKKRICRFYRSEGGCRFGDHCKFEHTK